MKEDLLARLVEDRSSLTDEEFSELLAGLERDPALAGELRDQFLLEDLLCRRWRADRADFPAQALARRRAAATAEPFCRATLEAARRTRRRQGIPPEAAAAAVLLATLLAMLLSRGAPPPPAPAPQPATPPIPPAGLRGEYFQNRDLTGPLHARIDPRLDFRWEPFTGPAPGLGDVFSARWTGWILPRYSEEYIFRIRNDDGVRLWIGGRLVVDDWNHRPYVAENRGRLLLEGGRPTPIKVEYYDDGDLGVLQLFWSSARQAEEIVPSSCLRPD